MRKLKKIKLEQKLIAKFKKFETCGKVKRFDNSFYDNFNGMYFNGLPVYYHLKRMNMKKCFETSAILALAMGPESFVCRGELKTLSKFKEGKFLHGWVEMNDLVYDTTFQIICSKKLYVKLFKPINVYCAPQKEYMEYAKEVTDWTIRTKEWYENNYSASSLLVQQVKNLESLRLEQEQSLEEQKFIKQLLLDLPDCRKMPYEEFDIGRIF